MLMMMMPRPMLVVAALAGVARASAPEEWPFFPFRGADVTTSGEGRLFVPSAALALTYQADRKMPPGCECRKSGDTDNECKMFECFCICDLTAGACDANCCCDLECTEEQRERFTLTERCAAEGSVEDEITKCYSTREVDRINPKFPMTAKETAKDSVDRLLCVRYDNSDLRGEFYDDPGFPDASVFDEDRGQKDHDFAMWNTVRDTVFSTDGVYDAGDAVAAAYELDGASAFSRGLGVDASTTQEGFVLAFGGRLPLPRANSLGACDDGTAARFAEDVGSTCDRQVTDWDEQCASGDLGTLRFTRLKLGRASGTSPESLAWVDVDVRRVTWRAFDDDDPSVESAYSAFDATVDACNSKIDGASSRRRLEETAGTPTPSPTNVSPEPTLTFAPTPDPTVSPSPSPSPKPTVAPGTPSVSPTPRPTSQPTFSPQPTMSCDYTLDDTTVVRPVATSCRNVLAEVAYTIVYSAEGIITGASADLVLTDAPTTATALRQTFRTRYVAAGGSAAAPSRDLANIVNRTRSGNPGYIFGKPVLAGRRIVVDPSDATLNYVLPRTNGLRLLGSGADGHCAAAAVEREVATFGGDAATGCVVAMTRADLMDFCAGVGEHAAAPGVPSYFNVSGVFGGGGSGLLPQARLNDDRVGIFGNADPLDVTQWLPIHVAATEDGALWREREATCENAVTSLNYRILWAYVGKHSNPQPKIIAVRAEFAKENLVFPSDGTNGNAARNFAFTTTLTFVEASEAASDYAPPSPPIAVSVPYDVWYPFKIDSHGAPAHNKHSPLLALLSALAALLAL